MKCLEVVGKEILKRKRYEEDVEEARANSIEMSRRYREIKKLDALKLKQGQKRGGFQSLQFLGKAMKRVYMALPSSPNKQQTLHHAIDNATLFIPLTMIN
ncbi:hypothetical protein PoB_006572000 [Plakobranchus ocellatus]|uniref:Uncharacterized protein n=1 Tax=Plakobranchus ocellatus TaxID=259542 RepID=A0AAV4D552_9GAST|nr:hypothetical protein PoB_006572000 [Plakobranchus ocellatus]